MRFLAIIVCFAAAFPDAHAQTAADVAKYSGPDRTQMLIDGAKKEGTITLYSSAVVADSNVITEAFERKYRLKVQLWRGSSEDILRRAVTEHRGGRDDVDVAETAGTEMEGLRREQLLQEISSPVFADLMSQAVVAQRPWVTSRLSIFTAAFNTTVIKPTDAPKSYADLADPKWKGKLGIEADDANWLMSVAGVMGEDKTVALFRGVVAANGVSVRKGHTLLSNLVVAGEFGPVPHVRPNTRSQLRKHNFSISDSPKPRLRIAWTRFCSPAASPSSAGIVAPSKSEPKPTPSSPACSSICSMCRIIRSNGVSLSWRPSGRRKLDAKLTPTRPRDW